ncbi:MAG TPA: transketolase C-terminal domain-containing protein, partial [Burkholderiales bacterium]|nr:transketolase C-terminal domain-containing protein [Burkholderiales bacterium]
YPRGTGPGVAIQAEMTAIPLGKAQIRRKGSSGLLILAFGALLRSAEIIGERLDATVVNMRFVKPLDEDLVLSLARTHTALVTIEENAVQGGAGSACLELLANCESALPSLTIGVPDQFIEHGSREDCLQAAGLDLPSLEAAVRRFWEQLAGSKRLVSAT